jgi:hypothetical protein
MGEGGREQSPVFSDTGFNSISQVDVIRLNTSLSPLHPWERGKREQSPVFSDTGFNSISQVDVTRLNTSVSSLSLRERARVRAAI